MTKTTTNAQLLENIAEEINDVFNYQLNAEVHGEVLLISAKSKKQWDMEELEDLIGGSLEYVTERTNVDFNLVDRGTRWLGYELLTY